MCKNQESVKEIEPGSFSWEFASFPHTPRWTMDTCGRQSKAYRASTQSVSLMPFHALFMGRPKIPDMLKITQRKYRIFSGHIYSQKYVDSPHMPRSMSPILIFSFGHLTTHFQVKQVAVRSSNQQNNDSYTTATCSSWNSELWIKSIAGLRHCSILPHSLVLHVKLVAVCYPSQNNAFAYETCSWDSQLSLEFEFWGMMVAIARKPDSKSAVKSRITSTSEALTERVLDMLVLH